MPSNHPVSLPAYVDAVLAGKTEPDAAVGRQLLDMVHSVPKMSQEQFDEMINSNIKVGQWADCARQGGLEGLSCWLVINTGVLFYSAARGYN